jgi:hypothetical protein
MNNYNNLNEMIIGCLLGDAHIGITGSNKAFITFEQSTKNKEYLLFLYNFLNELNLTLKAPIEYQRIDSRYNKVNTSIYFRTQSLEIFKVFADLFLNKEGKKIINKNIIDYLTIRSLAF